MQNTISLDRTEEEGQKHEFARDSPMKFPEIILTIQNKVALKPHPFDKNRFRMTLTKDDELRSFLEETDKYTKTLENLKITSKLPESAVQSLLKLVRGIDGLLTRQDQPKDNVKQVKDKVPVKKAKQVEFDVATHRPKNFDTPIIPLDKNCPGLNERGDFRTVAGPAKKRK